MADVPCLELGSNLDTAVRSGHDQIDPAGRTIPVDHLDLVVQRDRAARLAEALEGTGQCRSELLGLVEAGLDLATGQSRQRSPGVAERRIDHVHGVAAP